MTDDGARTLPELLRQRALADGNAVALSVSGGASLTYQEWQQRSDAASAALRSRDIVSGARVILMFGLASWTEYAVGYQAVLKAGGVAVPVPVTLTDVEVTRLAADCTASGLVVAPGVRPPAGPWWAASLAELEFGDHRPPDAAPHCSDPAEILYVPRALAAPLRRERSHADLVAGPADLVGLRGGGPRSLLHASPIGSELAQLVMGLAVGSRPALALALANHCFDPDRFSTVASGQGVEALGLSPLMGRLLLESGAPGRHDLSTVRCLLMASGGPPASVLSRLAGSVGGAVVTVGLRGCGRGSSIFLHDISHPGAVGLPALPAQLSIYAEEGREGARGIGRVWIAGSPTGETGHLDEDGFLYLLSPCDRVVRWERTLVLAREVEEVLGGHPAVADVSLVGLPHDDAAERLVGAVVLRSPTSPPAPEELIELVSRRLGAPKAPSDVVVVDEIPRNHRGVVLLRRLRQRLAGLPVTTASTPATPTEEIVALAWQRVLGPQEFGSGDDFFERGGDELAATKALLVVEDALSLRVPLRSFLAGPTVAGLGSSIDALLGRPDPGSSSVAPVATSQEGMLWHEQFAPGCQNLPALVRRYRGALDVGALEGALSEIMRRHEPLRTSFEIRDGRPVQVVHPPVPLRLDIRDLTALAATEQEGELARTVAEEGTRPFDLTREPLFTPSLVRLGPEDHVLIFRVHHSVYDDWSVGPFRRELSALYTAFTAGAPSPLADPPIGFADFARRQRQALAGERGLAELSYWRAALAGAPFVTQLPIGDPALPEGTPQAAPEPVSLVVPPELQRAVRDLARRERSTVFMTVLAAFGVLVHRHTGQDDLLIASVVANRNRTELEGLIGCFTKKIPVRLRVAGEDRFSDVLAGARAALLGALSHQDLPFETVLQESIGAAAAARGLVPHVGVMFQGVTPKAQELVLPGLTTTGLATGAAARRAHFMAVEEDDRGRTPRPVWGGGLYQGTFLILSMAETPEGLALHARGAFHPPALERLLERFQVLLSDLVARPDRPISEMEVLSEQDRAVLPAADDAPPAGPARAGVPEAFAAQVALTPGAVAVDDGHRRLTYAELDGRAQALANRLLHAGAGAGSAVGICLECSIEVVVAVLAVWKAGAAVVPLHPFAPDERLAVVMGEASVGIVVVGAGSAPEVLARAVHLMRVEDGPTEAVVPIVEVRPEDPALLFYGSGRSAGLPGVVISHSSVLGLHAGLRQFILPSSASEGSRRRICLSANPAEDPFLSQIVGLLDGHTLCVTPGLEANPAGALALLAAGALDVVYCTAAQLEVLVASGLAGRLSGRPAEEPVPTLVVGGRDAPSEKVQAAARRVRGATVHLVFGPPECTFAAAACAVPSGETGETTVARPFPLVRLSVLDRQGRAVPPQVEGELHVAGRSVALGYVEELGTGAAALLTGPGGARRYRTGQRARYSVDGTVELLGPERRIVDIGGFRVDLTRIEAVLCQSPDLDQVAVVAAPDTTGYPRLVAYVVPAGGASVSLPRLRALLWRDLPGYAWPSDVVVVESLPLHESTDVAPAPPAPATGGGRPYVAPTTNEEVALASAWAAALGVERVSVDENYWQEFSFLDALDRMREDGMAVESGHVTRNRTVETLAAALAAERLREDSGSSGHGEGSVAPNPDPPATRQT